MNHDDFVAESFRGTLAFGRLVLAMLFVASLVAGSSVGVASAIASCAFAYISQALATNEHKAANPLMLASLIAGAISFICVVAA